MASEYVELVGGTQGRFKKCETRTITQDEIAETLGISRRTLNELLEIDRKLIPQIRELFDNGEITKYTANKVWCKLSPEDQERFFNEIGKDKISQMTQAQTQKYIDDLRRVETEKQMTEYLRLLKLIYMKGEFYNEYNYDLQSYPKWLLC